MTRGFRQAALYPALRPSRLVPDEDVRLEGHADRGADRRDRRRQAGDLRRLQGRRRRRRAEGEGRHPGRRAVRRRHPARRRGTSGYSTACPAEKSGQDEFDFEYGEDFARAHRGVRPDLLQGAGALQPGGRPGAEPAAGRPPEAAVRLPARPEPSRSCSSCWCRRRRRSSTSWRATRRPTTWSSGPG